MKSLLQKVTIDEHFTAKTTNLLPVFKAILHCQVQPIFLTTNPRDLGVRRTKRSGTYHAKDLSADDTHGNLLVWHPVRFLRRSSWWNEHLLTAMYCSHLRRLPAQTPCGARWSRLALSFLLLFQSQCT